MAEVYGSQQRPRKRWGRRLLITFIVLLIIVVGILAVVDRFGASYAEREISDRVAQQVANQKATSEKPDVTIEGVPFLTQVVKGEYQEIKIELNNFAGPAGDGKTIKMPLLDIRAKDVKAPLDTIRRRGVRRSRLFRVLRSSRSSKVTCHWRWSRGNSRAKKPTTRSWPDNCHKP